MARTVATTTAAPLSEVLDFARERRNLLLATARSDGRPQVSPVSGGIDGQGRIIVSTYPGRAKTVNAKRTPEVSVVVLSDDFGGPWVQIDGTAEVLDMPEAEDALVDYYRSLAGEHPDWDEYRAAMRLQGKSLIRITPTRWGPIATGGFPADIAARLDARDEAAGA